MRSPLSSFSDISTIINTIVTVLGIIVTLAALQKSNQRSSMRRIAIATSCVAGLTLILRWVGLFQPLELAAYDWMMQLRPSEGRDPRITIVTISEKDIQDLNNEANIQGLNNQEYRGSLSDFYLDQLLTKLDRSEYKPTTIGLDMYRNYPTRTDFPDLQKRLRSDRFFTLCKVRDDEIGEPAIPVHEEISQNRESFVGFSDVVEDRDGIIRRHLLSISSDESSCKAHNAFSLLIALHYLHLAENKNATILENSGEIQVNDTIFAKISPYSGAYQLGNAQGYQILLNYRSHSSPKDFVKHFSIREVLQEKFDDNAGDFKKHIVLIGVVSSKIRDFWETPYSRGQPRSKKTIPGVFLQAHMVSQIISAVIDDRHLIRMADWWQDIPIFLLSAFCGVVLGWYRSWRENIAVGAFLVAGLGWLCYYWLEAGIWFGFVPSVFALAMPMTIVSLYRQLSKA